MPLGQGLLGLKQEQGVIECPCAKAEAKAKVTPIGLTYTAHTARKHMLKVFY
jgi:hypothetical protein